MPNQSEFVAKDGTIRKSYYGSGIQPWNIIKTAGWAPAFAAGNALKYVRRAANKNGEDDLKKARWYFNELNKLASTEANTVEQIDAIHALNDLEQLLTDDERRTLQEGLTV